MRRLSYFATLVVAVCLAGCGSSSKNQQFGNQQAGTANPTVQVGMQTNGVAPNRAIDVQFSTDMDPSTISAKTFLLAKASDGSAVSGTVAYDAANRVASFKPAADLSTSAAYNATITTGAADASGNHLAKAFSFSFSTRSTTDTSPIGVHSTNPANGTTGVDVNTKIQVVFTEGAESDSVTIASFAVSDANGARVDGAVTYDIYTNVAEFYPKAPLAAGMKYTVTIDGVRDLAGVPMTSPYVFTFTTAGAASGGGGQQAQDLIYEDDQLNDVLNGWIFDPNSASLTQASGSPTVTDQGPYQLLVSPNGNFLYAVMAQAQPTVRGSVCTNVPTEVIAYSIDHAEGALTLLQRLNLNGYCGGYTATMDAAGKFIYAGETDQNDASGMIDVVSLDPNTGKMSLVSGSPFAQTNSPDKPGQLVVAGNYLYAANNSYGTTTGILIYKRDSNTGSVQFQSGYTISPQDRLAALPSGTSLYSADMNSGTVTEFTIDSSTGSLTPQGTVSSGHDVSDMAIDPTGHNAAVGASDGVHLYGIDATGHWTQMSGSPFGGTSAISVAFDSTGAYLTAIQAQAAAGEAVNVYNLSGGTPKLVASATVSSYPARLAVLTK